MKFLPVLTSLITIILRRAAANRWLVAAMVVGVIVAAALLASTPIYTRALADLGLIHSLRQRLQDTAWAAVHLDGAPAGGAEGQKARDDTQALIQEHVGWLMEQEVLHVRSITFRLERPAEPLPRGRRQPRAFLESLSGWQEHVQLYAEEGAPPGRLPEPMVIDAPARLAPLEVAAPAQAAEALGLKVGDQLVLVDTFDNCNRQPQPPPSLFPEVSQEPAPKPCVPDVSVTLRLPVIITALVEPLEGDQAYWRPRPDGAPQVGGSADTGFIVPLLAPQETILAAYGGLLPRYPVDLTWTFQADVERFNTGNLDRARSSLAGLRTALEDNDAWLDSPLDAALASFHERRSFNQVPLLLLLLQIVGIVLFYIAVVVSLLVEHQSQEIALLRSRGASTLQILAVYLVEGLILGVVAVAVGPFLGAGLVALLGKTTAFSSLTGGDLMPVTIEPLAFTLSAVGAVLALAALLVPAFWTARHSMVSVKAQQARPGEPPLWQRYYLDLGLVGISALLLWELEHRETVFEPSSVGGLSSDPLLLFSPSLLMIAVVALILRFLPLVLRLSMHLGSALVSAPVALGLWQTVRNPAQYTRLGLLLMLVAGVATYAASYSATVDRSQEDRVRFSTGVDVRAQGLGRLDGQRPEAVAAALTKVEGVEAATTSFRGQGTLSTTVSGRGTSFQLLGLDPAMASQLLWYRDDFSDASLEELMASLRGGRGGQGRPLPGRPQAIALWVNPTVARSDMTIWLHLRDAQGRYLSYMLGETDFTGWHRLEVNLAQATPDYALPLAYPLSLHAIIVSEPRDMVVRKEGALYFDDISVIEDGRATVIEDFEGPFAWESMRWVRSRGEGVQPSQESSHSGKVAAKVGWPLGVSSGLLGLRVRDPYIPLPAVVSRSFTQATGRGPGQEVDVVLGNIVVPLIIRDVVDLFPTLDPAGQGFVIVNQEHLYYITEVFQASAATRPNEAWLQLSRDADLRSRALATLTQSDDYRLRGLMDSADLLRRSREDPLLAAGGTGILVAAAIALFALAALGFAVSMYIMAQRRKVEFAVMRAVGLSRLQALLLLLVEHLVVVALGLAVGTWAGQRIAHTMLSFLDVTEAGDKVLPPFLLVTDWTLLAMAYGGLLLFLLATIATVWLALVRAPAGQILRLTE